MSNLPLQGVRVISFEHFGAGPFCTMMLASFGAEVIRVESAAGEHSRGIGTPETIFDGDSFYFQTFNHNKKCIVLDLRDNADRAVFHELVGTAQVVVNNLRGSLPAKIGLDYASLKALNPAVVCGHISAYGRDNSRADRPGFDFLMQAEAGLMSLTGEPGAPPARLGVSIIDHMTGLMLAFGIASALLQTRETGIGCDIDAALFDTALHNLTYQGSWFLNAGVVTRQIPRSAHPTNTPGQLFKTADGWVFTGCMTDRFWVTLCSAIGREDLLADSRLQQNAGRLAARDELTATLDKTFMQHSSAEWIERLGNLVPIAPVLSIDDALSTPFVLEEAEMVRAVNHPTQKDMRLIAPPLRINGKRPPQRAGPRLDEQGDALRAEVAERIALRRDLAAAKFA